MNQDYKIDITKDLFEDPKVKEEEEKKNIEDQLMKERANKEMILFKKDVISNAPEMSDKYKELLEKKTAIIELNKIIAKILKEERPKSPNFFGKIKDVFSKKSSNIVLAFSSAIGGFFIISVITILTSFFVKSGVFWGLLSLLGLGAISVLSLMFLYEFFKEELENTKEENVFHSYELTSNQLIETQTYFDEYDKKIIKSINSKQGAIFLEDIRNVVKRKEEWVKFNEEVIERERKIEFNNEILNN